MSSDTPFLPQSEIFPEIEKDPEQFFVKLTQVYKNIAVRTNKKENSIYENGVEIQNGQLYFGTNAANPELKRSGFRKTLLTGTLATGANTIAHGITFPTPNTYRIVSYKGGIWDLTAVIYVPLPNGDITITVDTTNVNITIPAAYNGYDGYFTLEYLKWN